MFLNSLTCALWHKLSPYFLENANLCLRKVMYSISKKFKICFFDTILYLFLLFNMCLREQVSKDLV
jgi:hypothetical protein